jgi:processive 1,2-diacylglycerol beta-glucosyltransferase
MDRKKIAILSVSAGAGHVRAADALKRTSELQFSKETDSFHIDVMDMTPKLFRKLYAESYIKIVNRHPELWGYLYNKSDKKDKENSQLKKFRVALERLNTKKLFKELDALSPDIIICTHFLPAELISRLKRKKKIDIPCWVVVTDFDVHSLWVHEHVDGYFVASEEVAWRLQDKGIKKEIIHVTGIPIDPIFKTKPDRKNCAEKLGLNPAVKTVLMMSGGLGVGGIDELAERILSLDQDEDIQLIALAGKNKTLLNSLEKIASKYPNRLKPMGFTKTIQEVMAVADVAITKPGGLTTSECLALGLPMIAISPIPGQEERNADYLMENGAGMKAFDGASLEYRLKKLLESPERLQSMKKNSLELGHPCAAEEILKKILL